MIKYLRYAYRYVRHLLVNVGHRFWVLVYMLKFCLRLIARALMHDLSKFRYAEADSFARSPFMLRSLTYGTDAYKAALRSIKPALEVHYRKNRHHPEYFMQYHHDDTMSIVDRIEMVVDWKASTRKHRDGNMSRSIEVNQKRFGYDNVEKEIYRDIAVIVGDFTDFLNIEVARIRDGKNDKDKDTDSSGEAGSPNT